jgi:glycosyltransferase involved in cell wall biosynthesis
MGMLDQITPIIITYNEAPNIGRTLDKLAWAKKIVVVDSGSTDDTLDIVRAYTQVELLQKPFTDFASQCNFGLAHVATEWALSIDADYVFSDELISELQGLEPAPDIAGFRARFVYRVHGKPLHGTLYPPRVVLYRRKLAFYRNEGHGHRVAIAGNVVDLKGIIYHDDRKPLTRWLSSQQRYARDEARFLVTLPKNRLSIKDRVRLMAWPAPILILFYTLIVKRCILDGWAGGHYALQRVCAEVMLALEIVDRRLGRTLPGEPSEGGVPISKQQQGMGYGR